MEARDLPTLMHELKVLTIDVCDLDGVTPADIGDDERLINGTGAFHLGSLDALEIGAAIERDYGVRIEDLSAAKAAFRTIRTLAEQIGRAHV